MIIIIYYVSHERMINYFRFVLPGRSFLIVYGGAITSGAVSGATGALGFQAEVVPYQKYFLSPLVSSNASSKIHKQNMWGNPPMKEPF